MLISLLFFHRSSKDGSILLNTVFFTVANSQGVYTAYELQSRLDCPIICHKIMRREFLKILWVTLKKYNIRNFSINFQKFFYTLPSVSLNPTEEFLKAMFHSKRAELICQQEKYNTCNLFDADLTSVVKYDVCNRINIVKE